MNIHLTFDIDWAPNFCLENLLEILDKENIKVSFFSTHETSLNKEIINQGHNLGIHPNFLENSTQGKNFEEIINNLLKINPEATSIRTHSLYQSSYLLNKICSLQTNLLYDFSLYTPGLGLYKKLPYHSPTKKIWRLNFQWEDDICFNIPNYDWENVYSVSPLSIFNFHPIHIFLNSKNNLNYSLFKNYTDLNPNYKMKEVEKFINYGIGARDSFNYLIKQDKCISFQEMLDLLE